MKSKDLLFSSVSTTMVAPSYRQFAIGWEARSQPSALLSNQVLKLRMLLHISLSQRANHIHFQIVVPSILKGSLRQHPGNTSPAQTRGHLRMPKCDPSLPIHIELQIRSLALVLELKPVPRNL
jgi:hypothetical protein